MKKILIEKTPISVRFSEVDSLKIVWHGNYVKYMEDGREAFGKKFNLEYLTVYHNGFVTPIVKMTIDYKRPLKYGEGATVETRYIDSLAAKLIFEYTIYRNSDNTVIATGETLQVFLNAEGELSLTIPDFIMEWKKEMGLI